MQAGKQCEFAAAQIASELLAHLQQAFSMKGRRESMDTDSPELQLVVYDVVCQQSMPMQTGKVSTRNKSSLVLWNIHVDFFFNFGGGILNQ